jgi:hypothetical protein
MSNLVKVVLPVCGALLIAALAAQTASAHEPHDGLNFSIGVRGVAGCNTRASDVSCTLPQGQPFLVEVWLDELPDDIDVYGGFDLYAEFAGVTPGTDANNDDWPDCGFPAAFVGDDFVGWGCAMGLPPAGPSSWVGPIGSVTFTCAQDGSITLVHGNSDQTDLVEPPETGLVKHSEGDGEEEKLTIDCGTVPANTPGVVTRGTPGGPGPTPTYVRTREAGQVTPGTPDATLEPTAASAATATAQARGSATPPVSPTPDDGTDGDGGGVGTSAWIAFGVAAAAVVAVGAAGSYWYMRRRGGGGGAPA